MFKAIENDSTKTAILLTTTTMEVIPLEVDEDNFFAKFLLRKNFLENMSRYINTQRISNAHEMSFH